MGKRFETGHFVTGKSHKISPPRPLTSKGFLSSLVPYRGFQLLTHRGSLPSRCSEVPPETSRRPTPRSLPEERSLAAATSPKSGFYKIYLQPRPKALRVIVLGQHGVGKTALVVRFVTRRYIGEYDPSLQKMYPLKTVVDSENVSFEILDTAGNHPEGEHQTLEENIRWAEAYILVYSVTDKCSLDECIRLRFLINLYNSRKRRSPSKEQVCPDIPVLLVGNKNDQLGDRMVSYEDGRKKSKDIGCVCFHEISVRESLDQVLAVFHDTCRFWRFHCKQPKLKRSSSDVPTDAAISPDSNPLHCNDNSTSSLYTPGSSWSESSDRSRLLDIDEDDCTEEPPPFRERAQTDGHLFSRPRLCKYPPAAPSSFSQNPTLIPPGRPRRMSFSMRGDNTCS